ncbi:MAG: hypothetical protein HRT72_03070, partial [Flavobacteriales bacterium]|nr:hypothetical protein [Flavobacteriales bacterium]
MICKKTQSIWIVVIIALMPIISNGQTRMIHVFTALCDNENQGIVPVPSLIGNGKDVRNNLYWGAGYGVKSFLK